MKLELASEYRNSSGSTAANQYASEVWNGTIRDKHFSVQLNSTAAPVWGGDELSEDDRIEVMNELSERSGL